MQGELLSLLFSLVFVTVLAEVPLLDTALQVSGGSVVAPCSSVAFTFVVPPRNTSRFMFAIELVPITQASWTMTLTRDNPETSFGVGDACALDTVTLSGPTPNPTLVLVKSCGKLEGKWFVTVKSDSAESARFAFNNITYRVLTSVTTLPIFPDSQEVVSQVGKRDSFPPFSDVLQRYDFFQLTLVAKDIPKGSPLLIEITSTSDAGLPASVFTFVGTELGFPACGGVKAITGLLQLTPCEVQQKGTWWVMVERRVANQAYEIKAYWEKAIIVDVPLGVKDAYTLTGPKKTIYFKFSGSWAEGYQGLTAVADNVFGGKVSLFVDYKQLPLLSCSSPYPGCTTDRGCHVSIPPCLEDRRSDVWYAAVQAESLDSGNKPITFTFSWFMEDVTPKTVSNLAEPLVGTLSNGEIKAFFIPFATFAQAGSWIRLHLYIDSSKKDFREGYDAMLYTNKQPIAGPNNACSGFLDSCSASEFPGSGYLSCSVQLSPCKLSSLYSNGLYFSVEAVYTSNNRELWFQNVFEFTIIITHDIVPVGNDKTNPLLLDTGDVYSGLIPQNQYIFFRVPLHKGSVTVALSAPRYDKQPPATPLECRNFTVYGVSECIKREACGWCIDKCVPCSGKVGSEVVCETTKITGCTAIAPTPPPAVNPPTTAPDFCAAFTSEMCTSPNLAGVCGWCSKTRTCGECTRTLIAGGDRWCSGELPRGCETVRGAKRSLEETTEALQVSPYGPQKLQMIVSYSSAFIGPTCGCWKPDLIFNVREGETIFHTIDSCRATPTYIGVYGALPLPTILTPWQCILNFTFPVRLSGGDVQCMSLDGRRCLAQDTCANNLRLTPPASIVPVTCGEQHRRIWGGTGYATPTHWCALSLTYFGSQIRQYSEIPYTVSVRESVYGTRGLAVNTLQAGKVFEAAISPGETQDYELKFDRVNLLQQVLVVRVVGHWQSDLKLDLGILEGRKLETDSCYSVNTIFRSCRLSTVNGGICTIVWGQCEWQANNDTRKFGIRVHRDSSDTPITDPTDSKGLYNLSFELVSQGVRNYTLGKDVSASLVNGLYHHYALEIERIPFKQELVVEAYFDAGHQLQANDMIEVFLNKPERPFLAGEISECFCHQVKWSDHQKVTFVISPCEISYGVYHLSIKTRMSAYDAYAAQYTLRAFVQSPRYPNFKLDFPTDHSAFLIQRSDFHFQIPSSMLDGKSSTNTTLKVSLATQGEDIAVVSLHKGNESACGCYNSIAKCSTQENIVAGQRPYCEFEIDWCNLAPYGSGDYYLTVYPEKSVDAYNPVPFTVFAGVRASSPTLVTLTPNSGCGLQTQTNFTMLNGRTQHFRITPPRELTDAEVIEVTLSNIKNGNLQVNGNSRGFATSQCRFAEPVRCTEAAENCVLRLSCAKKIDYISVKVAAKRGNVPVEFSISSCFSKFGNLAFGTPSPTVKLTPGGSESFLVELTSITASQVPTILIKVQPTQNDVPLTLTFSQGRCSACSDFVKISKCTGGACWLAIHFWQLPENWATANWFVQVDNPDKVKTLNFVATVTASPATTTAVSMFTGSKTTLNTVPGTWSVVEWVIGPTEASRDTGIASGRVTVTLSAPAPIPVAAKHAVTFLVSAAPLVPTDTPTLVTAAGGSGGALGFYDIASCCLGPGKWYAYVWNGNPNTTWTVGVVPTIQLSTFHIQGELGVAKTFTVSRGNTVPNVFVKFPGFPLETTDAGTALQISVRPTDGLTSAVTIYTNVNIPAGPNRTGSCTTYRTATPSSTLYQSILSCAAAPLDPSIYWIGVTSPSLDRTYQVLVSTVLPNMLTVRSVDDNIWSSPITEPIGILRQSKVDIIDSLRVYGIRSIAQVEITAGTGTVALHWNLDAAAGPYSTSNPCSRSLGSDTARKTDAVTTIGTISLPRCLEDVKSIYLGTTVTSGSPTYRVRVASRNLFPGDQTRVVTLAEPSTTVTDAGPEKQHLINFQLPGATPTRTNYVKFAVNNIKWVSTPGTVTITWGQAGSCGFVSDAVCTRSGDSCVTIAYPCEIDALAAFSFHVQLSQSGSYTTLISLEGSTQAISDIKIGEERQVLLEANSLRFFSIDLRKAVSALSASDQILIQTTDISCGRATAWINRANGASPSCTSKGSNACSTGGCTLYQISACDMMTEDIGGIYHVTVRGLQQFDPKGSIKFRLKVSLVKGALSNTTVVTFLGTEEHRLVARGYDLMKSNPVTEALATTKQCTPEVLPQFASCCGITRVANTTHAWITDSVHYEYVVTGGHHLGYGAKIEVGVFREVASATVVFTTDYPRFCTDHYSRLQTCTATPNRPCTFDVDSCAQSTRQVWIWVNPDTVKWVSSTTGPVVAPGETTYEVAWIRPWVKEYSVFEVTPPGNRSSFYSLYHPFWLLPGEMEYVQIAHPPDYMFAPNYHVHVSVEKVFGGAVEIVQENAWTPCSSGECLVRECHTVIDEDECTQKAPACRCENLNRVYIPPCYDPKQTERYDDDRADHIMIKAVGVEDLLSPQPITGRIKFSFWEQEEYMRKDRCEVVMTGKSRFFIPNGTLGVNQIWKFTLTDMEQDAGSLRLSLNAGKIALPRVSCAERSSCQAIGDSCSLFFRGDARLPPKVSVYGEQFGTEIAGLHHFYITAQMITPDVITLTNGLTSVSPLFKVDRDSCVKALAPQYYQYRTQGNGDYLSIVVVAPNARAWINRGHLVHGWGLWTCDGRQTGGICETVIACDYRKTSEVFYIHVEGSSHEITVYENTVQVTPVKFGTSLGSSKLLKENSVFAFRLTDVRIPANNDPTRDLVISLTGRIINSWLSYDKYGDPGCRIPQTSIASTPTAAGTLVNTIPSCLLPAGLNRDIYANVAPTLPRHGDASCPDREFSISSNFVSSNFGINAANTFTGATNITYMVRPTIFGVKAQHRVDIGWLGNNDVIVTRVTNANMPLTHTLWKTNYDNMPRSDTCSSSCSSEAQTREVSWFDSCWHCGGGAYSSVFVQLENSEVKNRNLRYNLRVEKRSWRPLNTTWSSFNLTGDGADVQLFTFAFNRSVANVFELKLTSGFGVEIDVFPADCHRRDLTKPLAVQPLTYHCFKGGNSHVCEIPLSRRWNAGSRSTKESRIWADDNIRFVVRGYQVSFDARISSGSSLCAIPQDADFCANTLSFQQGDVRFYGGITNTSFDAQDRWAESFYKTLVATFDCPPDAKCDCKAISATCKSAIKDYSCAYAFGSCSERRGFQRPIEVKWCHDVVTACRKTFFDLGLGHLDCRQPFYTNQTILNSDAPPPHTPPPPYIPPNKPIPPPVIPPPPSNVTPPSNGTEPVPIDTSGLSRAAKLGITLASLAVALVIGTLFYSVIIRPRVGLRNTIEAEGYTMM